MLHVARLHVACSWHLSFGPPRSSPCCSSFSERPIVNLCLRARACVRACGARACGSYARVVHVVLRAVMRWLFGFFAVASAPARLPMLRLLRDPLRDRLARPVPLPNQSHGREQMSVGMMLGRYCLCSKGTSRERLLDIAPLPSSAHIEFPGRYSTGIQLPRGTPTAVTARRVGDQKRKPIG